MPELLLALDAGTTTVRACLYTPAGDLIGRAAARVVSRSPAPGRVEQDATSIWRAAKRVMAKALTGRSMADLAAIGVTSQRTSALLWDRRGGRPLTPLVIWSDLRGAARAAELGALGFPVSAQQAATKLEGLVADVGNAADLIRQGRLAYGNIDSYLIFKLTGVHATDRSQAWPSGYLNFISHGWNEALIEAQHLDPFIFPALADTWGVIGATNPGTFGAAVPVAADIADQQAALVGHGAEAAGLAKVTYGTSATLNISTGAEFVWRGGAIPPFVVSSVGGDTRFCLEGMVYSAGAAIDWLRRTFHLGDHAAFARFAEHAPDAGGVTLLPAFQGLGAPHGDLGRRAAIAGLSLASGKAEIARAGLEGVAFRIREAFDHIHAETGFAPPEVLPVDGGLTASDALMQIQADVLGRPVKRHAHREATASGTAVCAARGVGLLAKDEAGGFARYDTTFEPRLSADEADTRFAAWKAAVHPRI